jgi:hypothetical protein
VPGGDEKKKKISLDFRVLTKPNISDFRGPCHDTPYLSRPQAEKEKNFPSDISVQTEKTEKK